DQAAHSGAWATGSVWVGSAPSGAWVLPHPASPAPRARASARAAHRLLWSMVYTSYGNRYHTTPPPRPQDKGPPPHRAAGGQERDGWIGSVGLESELSLGVRQGLVHAGQNGLEVLFRDHRRGLEAD